MQAKLKWFENEVHRLAAESELWSKKAEDWQHERSELMKQIETNHQEHNEKDKRIAELENRLKEDENNVILLETHAKKIAELEAVVAYTNSRMSQADHCSAAKIAELKKNLDEAQGKLAHSQKVFRGRWGW